VDPNEVSVSGLSSGAFFATQYQFAHSSKVKGAAVFAGGPYYCAQNQLTNAFLMCMYGINPIPLPTLEQYARTAESRGDIDPLSNLANHKVFLFSGTQDATVKPVVVKKLEEMYYDLGVNDVVTQFSLVSAHTFPTTTFGNLCSLSYTPYISKCNYDGAGEALKQIYGPLAPSTTPIKSNFVSLSQGSFTPGGRTPSALSLDTEALLYVPTGCKDKTANCKLHVAFHGCLQNRRAVGQAWIENAGYNGWAEANNILVLYPQTIASQFAPSNPNGCWDWWGYLDLNFATKKGPQIETIKNMIDHIIANY
jgi:hypothetical protein